MSEQLNNDNMIDDTTFSVQFVQMTEDINTNICIIHKSWETLNYALKAVLQNNDYTEMRNKVHETIINTNHIVVAVTRDINMLTTACRSNSQQSETMSKQSDRFFSEISQFNATKKALLECMEVRPLQQERTSSRFSSLHSTVNTLECIGRAERVPNPDLAVCGARSNQLKKYTNSINRTLSMCSVLLNHQSCVIESIEIGCESTPENVTSRSIQGSEMAVAKRTNFIHNMWQTFVDLF